MTKIGFFQFLFLFLVSTAFGQKVKYKDIFALLSTRQYEQAEPFLKTYLAQNTDNPNAYLYMGLILQEKAQKVDILRQTDVALANMDSAVYFLDRAHKTLDDREIRRNKEYYQAYNRRDLRTGEFGVKLSDIQFDIEKRIEGLKDRTEKVKTIAGLFTHSRNSYQRAQDLYAGLQQRYSTLSQLYLRSDDATLDELKSLALNFDSCVNAFNEYKKASAALGRTGYNQSVTLKEIRDFNADGMTVSDFLQDDITLWDFKKFADEGLLVIEKEIIPMRKHLITYDAEINKLREKFSRDSVSVRNDLMTLVDRMIDEQLRKFDARPLPMWVFSLKTTQLEYLSAQIEHRPLRDSSDLHFRIALVDEELKLLHRMDSVLSDLSEDLIRSGAVDYASFVRNGYGSADGVVTFARDVLEFVKVQREAKVTERAVQVHALNYIVDANDSIPLTDEVVVAGYKPLLVSPEEYTTGITTKDPAALQGYFYTITPARKPEVKAFFPLDKSAFRNDNLLGVHGLVQSDASGQIFYVLIYSEEAIRAKFPATLSKIYRSDGLAWHMNYSLPFVPSELFLATDTGEVIISNGEDQFVVDKNGKAVR
jgi:hypothetical protein